MSKAPRAKDLMSPNVITVGDEMTTEEAARYLIEREISGAPVVDTLGHLVGIVSMTDIGRSVGDPPDVALSPGSGFYGDEDEEAAIEDRGIRSQEERAVMVRDVMTPAIHQLPVTASVAEVARLMVAQHIHRVVVTEGKEPVGIITSMDVLKMLADKG
jgi:CBS domain-containing protein